METGRALLELDSKCDLSFDGDSVSLAKVWSATKLEESNDDAVDRKAKLPGSFLQRMGSARVARGSCTPIQG